MVVATVAKPARQFGYATVCKFFCVYRPYKESISKEMNNDNDLNLHSMTESVELASLLCGKILVRSMCSHCFPAVTVTSLEQDVIILLQG